MNLSDLSDKAKSDSDENKFFSKSFFDRRHVLSSEVFIYIFWFSFFIGSKIDYQKKFNQWVFEKVNATSRLVDVMQFIDWSKQRRSRP